MVYDERLRGLSSVFHLMLTKAALKQVCICI